MTMQRDPIVAKASELMRLDIMPSLAEIRGGKVGHSPVNITGMVANGWVEYIGYRPDQGLRLEARSWGYGGTSQAM